jgi:RNA polymerase sigma-70 factor (ECF subfamily)
LAFGKLISMQPCEWEELSVTEAAAVLETTPKAVESRLYRARQILRERLKPWL